MKQKGNRERNQFIIFILFYCIFIVTAKCENNGLYFTGNDKKIYGIKVYFNNIEIQKKYGEKYENLINEIKDVGFNTIFTTAYEGNESFFNSSILEWSNRKCDLNKIRELAKKNKIKFAAICQVFFDPYYADKNPDLVPVDSKGNNKYVNWQKMLCPVDINYQKYKLKIIKEVIDKLHPDLLSLDFIRYPTTWELYKLDTNADSLREFCFCNRCLREFQRFAKIKIPYDLKETVKIAGWIKINYETKWENWKCKNITGFVKKVKKLLSQHKDIRLVLHIVPWKKELFNGGLKRIASQDIKKLAKYSDYLSPMIYHKLIGAKPEYIHEITEEFSLLSKSKILPSLQIQNIGNEDHISEDEFSNALEYSIKEFSNGFVLFNWNNLIGDRGVESKMAIRKIIR